jgi:hypothetical protein
MHIQYMLVMSTIEQGVRYWVDYSTKYDLIPAPYIIPYAYTVHIPTYTMHTEEVHSGPNQ